MDELHMMDELHIKSPDYSFTTSDSARRLNNVERHQFITDGYLKNLPVFNDSGVEDLQSLFLDLTSRLPDGIDINQVNMWHKASKNFHQLCRVSAILDYVEDLIGSNFVQWGGQFFVKYPGDGSEVPWHQDAQYWPLTPNRTVTVWLAIYDTNDRNAAMQVVRGSHRGGVLRHHTNEAAHLVLDQEVDEDQIDTDNIVTLDLRAGEISLHDGGLLHGSGPNRSDIIRAGITMRFCPTDVKCDLSVWPTFETYIARGSDFFNHNPIGQPPEGESFPIRKFQHSSDFI